MADTRFAPSGEYRVRPYRPVRTAIISVLVLAAIVGASWAAYTMGVRDGGYAAERARATEARLRVQVSELRERVGELARRNTLLQRAERIERDARERLRGVIEERDETIARIEEELAFYRNLVSPSKMEAGLKVRRIQLDEIPGVERSYRYELVLSQLNGGDDYAAGEVTLRFDGQRGGEPATVPLDEMTIDESPQTKFRFKYFQTLSGRIRLPEGFEPGWLQLDVQPSGEHLEPLEETYAWDSLLSGGA